MIFLGLEHLADAGGMWGASVMQLSHPYPLPPL